jgi:hypothetical protein
MSEVTFDVGLACKIKQALSRNSISDVADLDWLASGDNINKVRQVRLGNAEIVTTMHVIDCDANPLIPDGCSVEEHQKSGVLKWNPANVTLYFSKEQKEGNWIKGHKLHKELMSRSVRVMNANVLDYLLTHPYLIPEDWKDKQVFFWGTIYHNQSDELFIYGLYNSHGRWEKLHFWLKGLWFEDNAAAVSAS